jgi:hypothetical protein
VVGTHWNIAGPKNAREMQMLVSALFYRSLVGILSAYSYYVKRPSNSPVLELFPKIFCTILLLAE